MRKNTRSRAARIDRAQNAAILLLSLSALLLLLQTPLFGGFSVKKAALSLKNRFFAVQESGKPAELPRASLCFPLRMVLTNELVRCGADALTTADEDFETVGAYLGEAVGSAHDAFPVRESVFLAALEKPGIYFDFTTAIPLELFAESLGVAAPDVEPASVRRALLLPSGSSGAELYLQDGQGQSYRLSTAVSSAALDGYLASLVGNGVDLLGASDEWGGVLSPYTMIPEQPSRVRLTAADAVPDWEELLRRAGFNPHTESYYTDSSGTLVVREGGSTLSLRTDGTALYQGGAAAPDSAYVIAAAQDGSPTLSEALSAAQRLILALLGDGSGDAALYLSGVQTSENGCTFTADYMIGGTPLRFSDGEHAAVVVTEGGSIVSCSLRFRRYGKTDETVQLLPFAQAAAIAQGRPDAELAVLYADYGGESVSPCWAVN